MRFIRPQKILSFIFFMGTLTSSQASTPLLPEYPPYHLVIDLNPARDFNHKRGRQGHDGWEADYKNHAHGYFLTSLKNPLLLEPGLYRAVFNIRKGHHPHKGLMLQSYGLFRIEMWDVTTKELMIQRELQVSDFSTPNKYEPRWLEFSMEGRQGHLIEPRVYFMGLANGEISSIKIERFDQASPNILLDKAFQIGFDLDQHFLENGFVVSRFEDGQPDEVGDAATYTGFYAASLAWKYSVTGDHLTYQKLENALETLHKAVKGTEDHPYIVRFVDPTGEALPKETSKDVYTSFFFAHAQAYPLIKNEALKRQMEKDIENIANRFLQDSLTIKKGNETHVILTPHFTEAEVRHGIEELFKDKDNQEDILSGLKSAQKFFPFSELWPGMKKTIKAIKKKDTELLYSQLIPTMNGMAGLADRAQSILFERYRDDLLPKRANNPHHPGKRLKIYVGEAMALLPPEQKRHFREDQRFYQLSDLKILSSNALLSLNIIKTAAFITKKPQFIEYYRTNLYTQDALLQTALNWYETEERFIALTSGNQKTDKIRRGYLSAVAIYNLFQLETNPAVKESYAELMNRWWTYYQHEDNPMARAFAAATLTGKKYIHTFPTLIEKDLQLYPENRKGFGIDYWREKGKYLAQTLGGGYDDKYAREPVPISHRPKDSFLWQRNARRLKGDFLKFYPGTDYLFVYWLARKHHFIPAPDPKNISLK